MKKKYQIDLLVPNSHFISPIEKEWLIKMRENNPNSYICKNKINNKKLIQVFNVSNIITNDKLKTKVRVDKTKTYFQNHAQYQLYVFLEQFFDNLFFDNYFRDNDLIEFINNIDDLLSYIPEEKFRTKL